MFDSFNPLIIALLVCLHFAILGVNPSKAKNTEDLELKEIKTYLNSDIKPTRSRNEIIEDLEKQLTKLTSTVACFLCFFF
jgi:hypothetical protein